jgi:uncharacterized membrane protein YhhN
LIWIIIPLSIAVVDWFALYRGWARVDYLAKPGTVLALMVWLWGQTLPIPGTIIVWILVGLLFSLLGDTLLMLPTEQFLGGLFAFFLAHLAYILALNPTIAPLTAPLLGFLLVIGMLFWALIRPIIAGLRSKNKDKLVPFVLAYTGVISLMLLSAWVTVVREAWPLESAVLLAGGASSFFLSDFLLAWNRFVRPIHFGRLIVRILYHLGQITLAAGALLASPFI